MFAIFTTPKKKQVLKYTYTYIYIYIANMGLLNILSIYINIYLNRKAFENKKTQLKPSIYTKHITY